MDKSMKIESGAAVFSFALTKEEFEAEIQTAYMRNKGKYNIPGYRKGHAPRKMIELHYGAGVFFDDAVDNAVTRCYYEAMQEHPELDVYGKPEVKLERDEKAALAFTVTATLIPAVKLPAYKGMKLKKIAYNVTDEDVENRIKGELEKAARIVTVDRAVQDGDTVNIDFTGYIDGEAFEGGAGEGHDLVIGSKSFIPGFEDQLIGKSVGECEINVKFPDDYHSEKLKGKDSVFKVKINEVKTREIPAFDEAFVTDRSEFKTVEEYRNAVKESMIKEYSDKEENDKGEAALKAVCEATEIELPYNMVSGEVDILVNELQNQLSQYAPGMKVEDYLQYTGTTLDDYRKSRMDEARDRVKTRLVVQALVEAEKLDITDEEFEESLKKLAASVDMTVERYTKSLGKNARNAFNYMRNELLIDKLMNLLITNNEYVLDEEPEKPKKSPTKKATEKKSEGEKKSEDGAKKSAAKKPAAKKTTEKATTEENK